MQPFDASVPNVARMSNYCLGGKDHFEADRQAADQLISRIPQFPAAVQGSRQFLRRAVTAVAQASVRQFIDIGSGLPAMDNTHDVAHEVDPGVKVAYVDQDPQAVTHARMRLEKGSEETVRVLDADLREPEAVTGCLGGFIDFTRPVGLILSAVMHYVETPDCYRVVDEYRDRMTPGSFLILSHFTGDFMSPEQAEATAKEFGGSGAKIFLRCRKQVSRLFGGLALLEPGLTDVATWRAGPVQAQRTVAYGGVGRKVSPGPGNGEDGPALSSSP